MLLWVFESVCSAKNSSAFTLGNNFESMQFRHSDLKKKKTLKSLESLSSVFQNFLKITLPLY